MPKGIFRNCLIFTGAVAASMISVCCNMEKPGLPGKGNPEQVMMTFNISKADAAVPSEAKEYEINTLRIYAFDQDGKLYGYHYSGYEGLPQSTATIGMTLPTGTMNFYVIANEAAAGELKKANSETFSLPGPTDGSQADIEDLRLKITPDILNSLTFSALPEAVYTSGGTQDSMDETGKLYESPFLPMTARRRVTVSEQSNMELTLRRSVGKMKLYFSTTGTGECYMGRGLYLYNEPQYGYLFPPRETVDIEIGRKENSLAGRPDGYENNKDYNDSYLHQLNGRVILHSGWPQEPEGYDQTVFTEDIERLDINRIEADVNDPLTPQYEHLPQKSFYLFANPYRIYGNAAVTSEKPEGDGYYLKILVHQHGKNQEGTELHAGEKFYLSLPSVQANDCVSIYSVVSLDGYVTITPSWTVQEWQYGGGDITFN